jgi:exocyst complex component 4
MFSKIRIRKYNLVYYKFQQQLFKIREDLSSCKTLLHCKRDELRRLWIEGVEHKAMVALLDQV